MKRVTELLVATDVANSLVALKMEDGNLVAMADGDTVATSKQIYISQIDPDTGLRYSLPIAGKEVRCYKGQAYVAPTALKKAVGYNGTSGAIVLVNNAEYRLAVVVKSEKEVRESITRFNYLTDASATEDEIATSFVASINADLFLKSEGITAAKLSSGTARGIELSGSGTGQYGIGIGPYFDLAIDGGFFGTPTSTSQAMVIGSGTPKQVRALEEVTKGYKGVLNRIMLPDSPTYFTNPASNYHMIVIEHGEAFDKQDFNVNSSAPVTTIILIPTVTATFDDVAFIDRLDDYMNSVGFADCGL